MARRLVLALALALGGVSAGAEPVQMRAPELLAFGEAALQRGFADQALGVAEALLRRDAGDVGALILRAQGLRMKGRYPESAEAARRAWRLAEGKGPRYAAATALAQALSLQGHRLRAQYWLRQAVQNAPSGAAGAQALQDLRYVRGETPLALRFDLALQPSDNVNGGAKVDSVELMGVSFPLPARLTSLSGLGWSLGVQGDYRLAADPGGETALTFGLQRSGAALSAEAKALGAQEGDLDFLHLGLGIARKMRGGDKLALDLGRNWYGGADLSATLGLTGTLSREIGPGEASFSLSLTREMRLDQPGASSSQGRIAVTYALNGPGGDQWALGASLMAARSGEDTVARQEAGLSLDWQAARPLGGMALAAHLGVNGANYRSGRTEGRLRASLEAEITRASWLGFAPVLAVNWARGNSNSLIHDTESLGLALTIRSRF
ncbi:tetratricopeptide repeat protein [Stagnihabitans tardus]|uniref:DUF560 domain-containing protein n=1 Tax=Stagnihabitans tardus TaxID=2699202 RepID=A0AAE4Y9T7_9RHOB|nr:tetratricopeptide repeat protein [Stagnihabitans tardus]NBZ88708.1 hypothetical protein [Stagnihabitans tardus]